jgi:hypothetical protein
MERQSSMTVVLATIHTSPAAANEQFTDVIVHVNARVLSAAQVRRKVNGWLMLEVGDRLLAGEPELVLGEQLIWRVPVDWTSPSTGTLARTHLLVMVDAATGAILPDSPTPQEIESHVAALARTVRSAA